jgi:hypothetical protein
MPELWVPGAAEPSLDAFVDRVHRRIERYTGLHGAEQSLVEVELADGGRFPLRAMSADPGFGFLTLCLHGEDEPDELIVPIGMIRRIELRPAEGERAQLGFSLPAADA